MAEALIQTQTAAIQDVNVKQIPVVSHVISDEEAGILLVSFRF